VVLWRFDERAGTYFAVQDDAINGIEVIGPQRVKLPNR
jgi:hypothetical protein